MTGPSIAITNPTPPRAFPSAYATPSRPSTSKHQDRLLYRGALSLPDSNLLLDGLTFLARTGSPGKYSVTKSNLLDNSLALSLESMRGRTSLRMLNTVQMKDIWVDESSGIELEVHPAAVLTRTFFENMFCLEAMLSDDSFGASAKSRMGIRVAIGDSTDASSMVIFARLPEEGSDATVDLVVGRITASPPVNSSSYMRLPRPDDPKPREPPLSFTNSAHRNLKRTTFLVDEPPSKKPIFGDDESFADMGSGFRLDTPPGTSFKIPTLPVKKNSKSKDQVPQENHPEDDLFGPVIPPELKQKQTKVPEDEILDEGAIEKKNKNAIRKTANHYLTSGFRSGGKETQPVAKSHPDFKELAALVIKGSSFKLRNEIKAEPLDSDVIEKVVKEQVAMYAP